MDIKQEKIIYERDLPKKRSFSIKFHAKGNVYCHSEIHISESLLEYRAFEVKHGDL